MEKFWKEKALEAARRDASLDKRGGVWYNEHAMKKLYTLILVWLVCGMALAEGIKPKTENICAMKVRVERVVDGDTLDVVVVGREAVCFAPNAPYWSVPMKQKERVRLLGVDTPEYGESGFLDGSDATRKWVRAQKGEPVAVMVVVVDGKVARDNYDRVLGVVQPSKIFASGKEEKSLNSELLDARVADPMRIHHNNTLDFLRDKVYANTERFEYQYGKRKETKTD
jgi:endonuclease YncB( thermonuclease family)